MQKGRSSINPRIRLWMAVLADVQQRIDISERIGLDLALFKVSCATCRRKGTLTAQALLDHIEAHLAGATRVLA